MAIKQTSVIPISVESRSLASPDAAPPAAVGTRRKSHDVPLPIPQRAAEHDGRAQGGCRGGRPQGDERPRRNLRRWRRGHRAELGGGVPVVHRRRARRIPSRTSTSRRATARATVARRTRPRPSSATAPSLITPITRSLTLWNSSARSTPRATAASSAIPPRPRVGFAGRGRRLGRVRLQARRVSRHRRRRGPRLRGRGRGFRAAAAAGHVGASLDLGHCLMNGLGVPEPEPFEATRAYAAAAEGGLSEGAYHLAVAYLNGRGVRAQARAAKRWLLVAAEAGHAVAMHELAQLYAAGGVGVERDLRAAVKWYERSAGARKRRVRRRAGLGVRLRHRTRPRVSTPPRDGSRSPPSAAWRRRDWRWRTWRGRKPSDPRATPSDGSRRRVGEVRRRGGGGGDARRPHVYGRARASGRRWTRSSRRDEGGRRESDGSISNASEAESSSRGRCGRS